MSPLEYKALHDKFILELQKRLHKEQIPCTVLEDRRGDAGWETILIVNNTEAYSVWNNGEKAGWDFKGYFRR